MFFFDAGTGLEPISLDYKTKMLAHYTNRHFINSTIQRYKEFLNYANFSSLFSNLLVTPQTALKLFNIRLSMLRNI